MKRKVKTMSIEDAIKEKFPDATIYGIFCVGINLIWPRTFKPANMLPAVVIAAVCAGLPWF